METISACPHHGFDTWMLVNHFYDGMSPTMKQLLETMCGGNFLSKHPYEAMDFLNYVAETSKAWDEPNPREAKNEAFDPPKGRHLCTFQEELEMRNQHEVQAVIELPASHPTCFNCQSSNHPGEHCPMVPSVRDLMQEHAHVLGQNKPPTNAPYGNTYNPNWRNHPNLSWKPKPLAYAPQGAQQQFSSTLAQQQQQPPPSSPVEQEILNLSKVVGTFVQEQKVLNVQTNQKIETVESSLNKKLDSMQSEISNKYDNLQSSISRLSNQQQDPEKGKFPSQT